MTAGAKRKPREYRTHGSFRTETEAQQVAKEKGGVVRKHEIGGKLRYWVIEIRERESK